MAATPDLHLDFNSGAVQEKGNTATLGIYNTGLTLSDNVNAYTTVYVNGTMNYVNRGSNILTGASNYTTPTMTYGLRFSLGKHDSLNFYSGTTLNEFATPGISQTYRVNGVRANFRLF